MLYLDKNIVVNFYKKNTIRLYHPFFHLNYITSINVINLLNLLNNGIDKKYLIDEYKHEIYLISNQTKFNLWNCLYDNPDFLNNISTKFKKYKIRDIINEFLKNQFISSSINGLKKYE